MKFILHHGNKRLLHTGECMPRLNLHLQGALFQLAHRQPRQPERCLSALIHYRVKAACRCGLRRGEYIVIEGGEVAATEGGFQVGALHAAGEFEQLTQRGGRFRQRQRLDRLTG